MKNIIKLIKSLRTLAHLCAKNRIQNKMKKLDRIIQDLMVLSKKRGWSEDDCPLNLAEKKIKLGNKIETIYDFHVYYVKILVGYGYYEKDCPFCGKLIDFE